MKSEMHVPTMPPPTAAHASHTPGTSPLPNPGGGTFSPSMARSGVKAMRLAMESRRSYVIQLMPSVKRCASS